MRITPHANCRDYIWGGCRLENGGNPPKTNFKQVLDHLSGFKNCTFFDFQKKFFSLHPTISRSKRERFGIRFTTMSVIFLLLKPSASVIFGSPIEIK